MDNYKISHSKLKKIKFVTKDKIVIDNNGVELELNSSDFQDIVREMETINKISNSFYLHCWLAKTKPEEYQFYHKELKQNVEKYLIGKTHINLEKDYDSMLDCTDRIPYMQLKKIYESFVWFNLVSRSGDVLIKSLDDIVEPTIEKI